MEGFRREGCVKINLSDCGKSLNGTNLMMICLKDARAGIAKHSELPPHQILTIKLVANVQQTQNSRTVRNSIGIFSILIRLVEHRAG